MKKLAMALALALCGLAQAGLLDAICDAAEDVPTRREYNAVEHADNFCALALYEPHKAARQLNRAVAHVRAANNPNRF